MWREEEMDDSRRGRRRWMIHWGEEVDDSRCGATWGHWGEEEVDDSRLFDLPIYQGVNFSIYSSYFDLPRSTPGQLSIYLDLPRSTVIYLRSTSITPGHFVDLPIYLIDLPRLPRVTLSIYRSTLSIYLIHPGSLC